MRNSEYPQVTEKIEELEAINAELLEALQGLVIIVENERRLNGVSIYHHYLDEYTAAKAAIKKATT